MAGIYIHIPFCRSRCVYCGFYSTTSLELRQQYVDAVCQELPKDISVSTVYLGGGTPSQLTIPQLQQIFKTIYKYNKVSPRAEVTIEVNPDDVTEAFVQGLKTLPVNRVSMGIQTFSDERLRFLRRRHTAPQAIRAVGKFREAGIKNISIDLMYGFPGESLSDWQNDVEAALALNVEHLSAYCLMIEEGSPLYTMMNGTHEGSDSLCPIDEEMERQMYELLIDRLRAAGYEHYEISNFAKPGFRSRHNSSYWTGVPYIGIGAAAHSYDGKTRSWNVSDIRKYIDGMAGGKRIFEQEELDDDTRYNDLVTVALRTCEGLSLEELSRRHRDYCIKNARRFLNDGLLECRNNHLILTRKGLFVSDMVMAELMMV